jgi:hypothetical protein
MKFGTLTFLTTVILFGVLPIPVRLAAQNASSEITIFDASGAGTAAGSGFGTFPESINDAGAITGHYTDAHNVNHGFLRSPVGDKFITFDAPGAGTAAGSGFGTFPKSINDAGAITGHCTDANKVNHGFLGSHDRGQAASAVLSLPGSGRSRTSHMGQSAICEALIWRFTR